MALRVLITRTQESPENGITSFRLTNSDLVWNISLQDLSSLFSYSSDITPLLELNIGESRWVELAGDVVTVKE